MQLCESDAEQRGLVRASRSVKSTSAQTMRRLSQMPTEVDECYRYVTKIVPDTFIHFPLNRQALRNEGYQEHLYLKLYCHSSLSFCLSRSLFSLSLSLSVALSSERVRNRLTENVEALCCALWNGLNTAGTILDLTSMEIYEE